MPEAYTWAEIKGSRRIIPGAQQNAGVRIGVSMTGDDGPQPEDVWVDLDDVSLSLRCTRAVPSYLPSGIWMIQAEYIGFNAYT